MLTTRFQSVLPNPQVIVINAILKQMLQEVHYSIPLRYQFVDGITCAVTYNKVEYFRKKFNGFHERIKFTFEEENNGEVPFFDTQVTRDEYSSEIRLD